MFEKITMFSLNPVDGGSAIISFPVWAIISIAIIILLSAYYVYYYFTKVR